MFSSMTTLRSMVGAVLFALLSIIAVQPTYAVSKDGSLIFSAPPRESPQAGAKIYAPIADALSKILNRKVVYQHPENWQNYRNGMHSNDYDIVFDGPHFGAWRMLSHQHKPILRLSGSLDFALVTDQEDIKSLNDISGRSLCALSPPNMATLSALYPFRQRSVGPRLVIVKGGFKAVFAALQEDLCDVAVLRKAFWSNKVPAKNKGGYNLIWSSPAAPNQTITVSQSLDDNERKLITKAFTNPSQAKASSALFKRFSPKSKAWITAKENEYQFVNLLLDAVYESW